MKIDIPSCFEHLKGEDANFEMVTSNSIQPLNLVYHHNLVTWSIAYIFVNTDCNGFNYVLADTKRTQMELLFKEELNFGNVQVFENLTKNAIIDKLGDLKNIATEFEQKCNYKRDKPILAISISWIGHKL